MNVFIQNHGADRNKYLFADVWDTEVYKLPPVTAPAFSDELVGDVHPTHRGHEQMAEAVFAVLPEAEKDEPETSPEPTVEPTVTPTAQPPRSRRRRPPRSRRRNFPSPT